ncbi:MAG: hypothetical protein AABX82_04210 [Nanoarchaeota archaeon]
MNITAIKIQSLTAIKIFEKHNVLQEEVYQVLKEDKPQFRRVGGEQYVVIGLSKSRYVTIFFMYDEITKEAEITTAYPSDKKQIKSYNRVEK